MSCSLVERVDGSCYGKDFGSVSDDNYWTLGRTFVISLSFEFQNAQLDSRWTDIPRSIAGLQADAQYGLKSSIDDAFDVGNVNDCCFLLLSVEMALAWSPVCVSESVDVSLILNEVQSLLLGFGNGLDRRYAFSSSCFVAQFIRTWNHEMSRKVVEFVHWLHLFEAQWWGIDHQFNSTRRLMKILFNVSSSYTVLQQRDMSQSAWAYEGDLAINRWEQLKKSRIVSVRVCRWHTHPIDKLWRQNTSKRCPPAIIRQITKACLSLDYWRYGAGK